MAGTDKTPLFGTKGDKTNLRIRRHVFQDTGHFQQYTCAGGIIVGSRRIAHRVMMGTDNDDLTRVMIGVGPLGGNHVVRSGSTGKGERLHLHIIITVSLKFLHQIFNRLQFSIRSGHSRTDHLGQMVNVTVDIIHLDPLMILLSKACLEGLSGAAACTGACTKVRIKAIQSAHAVNFFMMKPPSVFWVTE